MKNIISTIITLSRKIRNLKFNKMSDYGEGPGFIITPQGKILQLKPGQTHLNFIFTHFPEYKDKTIQTQKMGEHLVLEDNYILIRVYEHGHKEIMIDVNHLDSKTIGYLKDFASDYYSLIQGKNSIFTLVDISNTKYSGTVDDLLDGNIRKDRF